MEIQKLNWAGIKLISNGKTILIDAAEDFSYYKPVLGDAVEQVMKFSDQVQADYILFTHLHLDHFDKGVIKKCLKRDGKVIVYSELEPLVRKHVEDVEMIVLNLDETFTENEITFKPVFAMDGVGEIQSSWIVDDATTKIFHGGDTIWHNQFWKLGKENKDIDYAFLPVNGVVVNFEIIGLEYSPVPASLNLKEAFAAAHLLHAKKLVPIHYGLFAHEKCYIPQLFDENDLKRVSDEVGQKYVILEDGKMLMES
ncbi:MBL fold metallo-hydrolase [Chryseobacterium jejuense]|uniref:L-ascorbate metabolism protein UlaG, beta-lactamase superfamily n=1 Tax=Chryseobacterium jejuense TaxID=445960 RepID=A0A2X2VGM8_CHRJE|nr:MBL fold metallo-hydrolase [Chryseobacterium jejuense]SDI81959.1 L-ascorbate metabolism protein UlaG, beta-lactamase superfamily [Chryseobacterium jejuense]SQB27728.1 metal-dependent hydrolase [Chryseobacterium jejuense]